MSLAEKTCVPCRGGVPPLTSKQIEALSPELDHWLVRADHHLEKHYAFADFQTGLEFVNRVGAIAEEQGHHPDLCLSWGKVTITIWTHKIDGLTESDFVLAAKIDRIER